MLPPRGQHREFSEADREIPQGPSSRIDRATGAIIIDSAMPQKEAGTLAARRPMPRRRSPPTRNDRSCSMDTLPRAQGSHAARRTATTGWSSRRPATQPARGGRSRPPDGRARVSANEAIRLGDEAKLRSVHLAEVRVGVRSRERVWRQRVGGGPRRVCRAGRPADEQRRSGACRRRGRCCRSVERA